MVLTPMCLSCTRCMMSAYVLVSGAGQHVKETRRPRSRPGADTITATATVIHLYVHCKCLISLTLCYAFSQAYYERALAGRKEALGDGHLLTARYWSTHVRNLQFIVH